MKREKRKKHGDGEKYRNEARQENFQQTSNKNMEEGNQTRVGEKNGVK